jgi:hypothetical protein
LIMGVAEGPMRTRGGRGKHGGDFARGKRNYPAAVRMHHDARRTRTMSALFRPCRLSPGGADAAGASVGEGARAAGLPFAAEAEPEVGADWGHSARTRAWGQVLRTAPCTLGVDTQATCICSTCPWKDKAPAVAGSKSSTSTASPASLPAAALPPPATEDVSRVCRVRNPSSRVVNAGPVRVRGAVDARDRTPELGSSSNSCSLDDSGNWGPHGPPPLALPNDPNHEIMNKRSRMRDGVPGRGTGLTPPTIPRAQGEKTLPFVSKSRTRTRTDQELVIRRRHARKNVGVPPVPPLPPLSCTCSC